MLSANDKDVVLDCIQKAKEVNDDIYNYCKEYLAADSSVFGTIAADTEIDFSSIFIGRVSHFLVECPGRALATSGSVCMPYYGYNDITTTFTAMKWTDNEEQWPD
jgi:hypothetical protein